MSGWCTIESDPGVFSELLENLGVQDVYMDEVISLDEEAFASLKPIHGLVFLFKWQKGKTMADKSGEFPNIYFAKQIVHNACATQAILNIVLNSPEKFDVGPTMKDFLEMTSNMTPEERGSLMGDHETLREAHNQFARHQNFSFEERYASEDDDVYHFIAYLPKDGKVYELDGLQKGPVEVGEEGEDWVTTAATAIRKRLEDYPESALGFNLLALCGDPSVEMEVQRQKAATADPALTVRAEDLKEKRKMWRTENQRRRHNYVPFLVHLLKALAKNGKLGPMVEKAVEKTKEDKAKEAEKKKEAKK